LRERALAASTMRKRRALGDAACPTSVALSVLARLHADLRREAREDNHG
jgi:hypothetical protein